MKTISFEIVYLKNSQIHQNGFVEVPDNEDDECEWFYYDQSGMIVPREFTHHEGIGLTQIGATETQQAEIEKFLEIINCDLVDWVVDSIVMSEEDENETITKGDILIHINDGHTTTYRDILNPKLLTDDHIGFFGDSEFIDENGHHMGFWTLDVIYDAYFSEDYQDYVHLDDEIDKDIILNGADEGCVFIFNDDEELCQVTFKY